MILTRRKAEGVKGDNWLYEIPKKDWLAMRRQILGRRWRPYRRKKGHSEILSIGTLEPFTMNGITYPVGSYIPHAAE